MKFERLPLSEAEGHILGHNVTDRDGRRIFRKGRALSRDDLDALADLGRASIYVARLEADDVRENEAARRLAEGLRGTGIRRSRASTGRLNFYAEVRGVLRIDGERLGRLNRLDGVALALLPRHSAVAEGKMVGTLKILPYALPETTLRDAEAILAEASKNSAASGEGGLFYLTELVPRRVALILSGSPGARERLEPGFETALRARLEALRARLETIDFVPTGDDEDEERLAGAIADGLDTGNVDLLILAGETAIQDRHDLAPRAVERAGGTVEGFGAPVDPGNLLLLAERRGVPIVGAPGCARSPKKNIVDLILPRLLAGDRLSHEEIASWGDGGLLEDVPERPQPRSWIT